MLETRSPVRNTAMVGCNWRKVPLVTEFSSDGADCLVGSSDLELFAFNITSVVEVYYVGKFQSPLYYAGKLKKKFYGGGKVGS